MNSLSAIWVNANVTMGSIGRPIKIIMLIIGKRILVEICFSSKIRGSRTFIFSSLELPCMHEQPYHWGKFQFLL